MLNNDALDDTPVPDVTPNFGGGLASYPPNATLAPNQFALGVNTMVTKLGEVQTRRSFLRLGPVSGAGQFDGLGYLDTAAGVRKLLRIRGGNCDAYDGAVWALAAGYAPTAGQPVDIVQFLDKLYCTNGGFQNITTWDGAAFVALAVIGPKYLAVGTNRLIGAGGAGLTDTVWFSDILDGTTWGAANKIRVGAGDGDIITGIAMWTKTLLAVFKRSRIYIVDINPANTVAQYTIDEVPTTLGCVSHRSIAKVGRDLWFLASDGTVRSLSRVLSGEERETTGSLSLAIHDQLAARSEDQDSTACAVCFNNRYLLSLWTPFPTQRKIFSYNTELNGGAGAWEGVWSQTGMLNVPIFARTKFSGRERLVAADDSDGSVLYWRHYHAEAAEDPDDFIDQGPLGLVAIATQVRTRGAIWGADQNQKRGFTAETEFGLSTALMSVKTVADDAAPVAQGSFNTPSSKKAVTLLHEPPFRSMQFDLSCTSGKLAVRAVRATAFIETMAVGQ